MNNERMQKIIWWLVRLLAILFIIFISLFALDVFGETNWPFALFMHLIPSYIVVALTVIAWNNERIGGALFIVGGLLFMAVSRFEGFVIYVPAILVGLLFLYSGWLKNNDANQHRSQKDLL